MAGTVFLRALAEPVFRLVTNPIGWPTLCLECTTATRVVLRRRGGSSTRECPRAARRWSGADHVMTCISEARTATQQGALRTASCARALRPHERPELASPSERSAAIRERDCACDEPFPRSCFPGAFLRWLWVKFTTCAQRAFCGPGVVGGSAWRSGARPRQPAEARRGQ